MPALADWVGSYLLMRRALGYQLVRDEGLLDDFAGWLEQTGDGRLTVDAAPAWATAPPVTRRRHRGISRRTPEHY